MLLTCYIAIRYNEAKTAQDSQNQQANQHSLGSQLKSQTKQRLKLKSKNNATIVITHYQRLLDYITPDFVHVLYDGKIIKSGGKELAYELDEKGYDWITKEEDKK